MCVRPEGWSHGGGVQVAARACSGLWLLAWHNIGEDGTILDGLL
jgi:hypothetical protein